jgi:predicted metal-dependent hydrolase
LVEYLVIQGTSIPYLIKKNPKYHVRLLFKEGCLVIETYSGLLDQRIHDFILTKSDWIIKHFNRLKVYNHKATLVNQLPIGKVWLLGKIFEYEFISDKKNFFRFQNQKLLIFTNVPNPDLDTVYEVIKAFSKKFLVQRTLEIANETGLIPKQVRVKVQRSKWGSCSSDRNINLNWRLIFLESSCIDYVIIHELCHLKHMNHSDLFWDLVEVYCPDYKVLEKLLKENQWVLNIYND